jgi:hypothetical protein
MHGNAEIGLAYAQIDTRGQFLSQSKKSPYSRGLYQFKAFHGLYTRNQMPFPTVHCIGWHKNVASSYGQLRPTEIGSLKSAASIQKRIHFLQSYE